MPPNTQPVPPVQQPDPNLNFVPDPTQQNQPQPTQPPVAQPDPNISQLQNDIAEIKAALTTQPEPTQQPAPEPKPEDGKKTYGEWGEVFADVEKLVDTKFQQAQQAQEQTVSQAQEQEQQNQQYIDTTVGQLRQAGYLPPVTNQFDANDPGKLAENELIGYAVYGLGSTDLVKAAQELKFRHDAGFKYDYQSKNWIQVNQPSNNPNDMMFGNLPQNPDQQPFPQAPPMPPQYPDQPVGPQNPYMPRQYPPGFNAPVSSGNTFMGTQGATPSLRNLRGSNYDQLVEAFNRTQ